MKLYHRRSDTSIDCSEKEANEQYLLDGTGWEISKEEPELTVAEMKKILKDNDVKIPHNAKKSVIIELLGELVNEAR